jgi:hypothetical protein
LAVARLLVVSISDFSLHFLPHTFGLDVIAAIYQTISFDQFSEATRLILLSHKCPDCQAEPGQIVSELLQQAGFVVGQPV